jgi:uncharacterized membrane protein
MNDTVKKILGYLAIAAVIILTLTFIKRLPSFAKLIALGANIFTIYFAYTELIKRKNKEK